MNKDLLYSTETYTQYLVIIYYGKEPEKVYINMGFPGGSDSRDSACNTGDPDSVPGLGRSPGEGKGNPLQYYCLGNPIDRGAWWATVHGVAKESDTTDAT